MKDEKKIINNKIMNETKKIDYKINEKKIFKKIIKTIRKNKKIPFRIIFTKFKNL